MAERNQRLLSIYPFTTIALGTGTILIAPALVALGGHTAAGAFVAAVANSGHGVSFMSILKGVGWVLGGIAQQFGEMLFAALLDGLFGSGHVERINKSSQRGEVRNETEDTEREKDESEKEVEVDAGKEKPDESCL